ncbi:hypothetical protein B0O99DRAFT_694579 [Bisporella sp. PMI_857]|nr:hypothetical protein B0O99DRAFT_694579 [Bisporella sp. PMI_857]
MTESYLSSIALLLSWILLLALWLLWHANSCLIATRVSTSQATQFSVGATDPKAFSKRNITAAWAACGLFPDNPDKVLRNTPEPPTQPTGPETDAMKGAAYLQDEAVQTPVSAKGLMSLYDLIQQDTQKLDATSTQRLPKRVQKLANAAQVSFAECALFNNRNQFLTEANNETKVSGSRESKSYELPGY